MAEVPRRKWLQVHLSTAVVLMFAAGGLIWANTIAEVDGGARYYGWPFIIYAHQGSRPPLYLRMNEGVDFAHVLWNSAISASILFAVWFVCERWIAWRAGGRKDER